MTIQFNRVDPPQRPLQKKTTDTAPTVNVPWVAPASSLDVAKQLFEFLQMLTDGRLHATQPLVMENGALQQLYGQPPPGLVRALHYQIDSLLMEIEPGPGKWGDLQVSTAMIGVALVAYITLTPNLVPADENLDPVLQFGRALLESLPPARILPEMLAYHAVLVNLEESIDHLSPGRLALYLNLLNLSPLSAVYHLHIFLPRPLVSVAVGLMPWWKRQAAQTIAPWKSLNDWLGTILQLIDRPTLAIYLRRRWLSLPETLQSCRNLGLLLEALRRAGEQRGFVLSFYEAYDRLCAQDNPNDWHHGPHRIWPVLVEIEQLLRTGPMGERISQQAALSLNRRGNEYFLKFYPLIEMIKADGHPPTDFRLLTNEFISSLGNLLNWITLGESTGLTLGEISFDDP